MLNAEALWGRFGAPGSPTARAYEQRYIVTFGGGPIPPLRVRREAVGVFACLTGAAVTGLWGAHPPYALEGRVPDDYGYASRFIRGSTSVLSNHAGGLAVDLNATTNPMLDRLVTDMPVWLIDYAEHVLGLRWGGHYSGVRKDAMHFEGIEGPAAMAQRTSRLLLEQLDRVGHRGDLAGFQRAAGLVPDGDPGPRTWTALVLAPPAGRPPVPAPRPHTPPVRLEEAEPMYRFRVKGDQARAIFSVAPGHFRHISATIDPAISADAPFLGELEPAAAAEWRDWAVGPASPLPAL